MAFNYKKYLEIAIVMLVTYYVVSHHIHAIAEPVGIPVK